MFSGFGLRGPCGRIVRRDEHACIKNLKLSTYAIVRYDVIFLNFCRRYSYNMV